jgi:hypothetical protein
MIHSIYSEISYRLDIFRATRGAHVEVYWNVVIPV